MYALMQLPHHDPIKQAVPDAMHTIKDVISHVFNLMTGREDNHKVHDAEEVKRFGVPSSKDKRKWDLCTCCLQS